MRDNSGGTTDANASAENPTAADAQRRLVIS